MDLSIIIVNWNSVEFLRRSLISVFAKTDGLEFEVIVVDNGSFDGCGEMLASEFPSVTFIQSPRNVGFAQANNLGVARSKGEAVLFLNPDTAVLGSAIVELWRSLEASPEAGAVGARLVNGDSSLQTSCVQAFPTITNQVLDAEYLRRKFPFSPLWGISSLFASTNKNCEVECVSGACLMARRCALEQVGGLNTLYFMYAEDIDLCRRLNEFNWKVYFVPRAEVVHYGGQSAGAQPSKFSAILTRESLFRYMKCWHGAAYAMVYRAIIGLVSVVRLSLIEFAIHCDPDLYRRAQLRGARLKWSYVLRWAIGMESWAHGIDVPLTEMREVVAK